MKRGVILFVFLLCVSFAYAQNFSVTDTAIKNTIRPDETAQFKVLVKNDGKYDIFKISVLSPEWISDLDEYLLSISGNEVEFANINLKPKQDVGVGVNKVVLLIGAVNDQSRTIQYPLSVSVENYENIVSTVITVPNEIDVRSEVPVKLNFKNKGLKDLKNIEVRLSSDGLNKSFFMDLGYKGVAEQDVLVKFDKKTKPGEHVLKVEIFENSKSIGRNTKKIKVVNSINVKDKEVFEKGILYSIYKVSRINDGNSLSKESIVLEIPSLKGFFSRTSPSPTRVKDGVYAWEFELKPGKEYTISVYTDYRPFVLELLCLILFVVMVYVVMKNKVSIRKKIEVLVIDGGKRYKVTLFIKNNKNYDLKNARIIDSLPGFLYASEQNCSVKPDKIVKHVVGTNIEWVIPDFESGTERVFSYEIYSTLRIVGKLQLPKAVVKYKNKRGKEVTDKSNFLTALFSRHR